jgi:hypothetical protein
VILTPDEIAAVGLELEREREWAAAEEAGDERDEMSPLPAFFARSPHLLMALGFDEHVTLTGWHHRVHPCSPDHETAMRYGIDTGDLCYPIESAYRAIDTGAWYIFDGWIEPGLFSETEDLHFLGPATEHNRLFPVSRWLERLQTFLNRPDPAPHALWSPHRWTPAAKAERREALKGAVSPILGALRDRSLELRSLHWRELELVVAELLATRGFCVDVTPRGSDGGRDVIACGELVPGEPMRIAIEVKQKPVVGLGDVQRALRANDDYPALLIATAGRFSAGVIHEKTRERNAMRLFLKDGVALTQWLRCY